MNNYSQPHIYEMAGLVVKENFVHQRKLSAKLKICFQKPPLLQAAKRWAICSNKITAKIKY